MLLTKNEISVPRNGENTSFVGKVLNQADLIERFQNQWNSV